MISAGSELLLVAFTDGIIVYNTYKIGKGVVRKNDEDIKSGMKDMMFAMGGEIAGTVGGKLLKVSANFFRNKAFQSAIKSIEEHVNRPEFLDNGEVDAGNVIMLERLRKIAKGTATTSQRDIDFLIHETTEAKYMKNGMSYDEAHLQTLKDQGIPYDKNTQRRLYTDEALKASDEQFKRNSTNRK